MVEDSPTGRRIEFYAARDLPAAHAAYQRHKPTRPPNFNESSPAANPKPQTPFELTNQRIRNPKTMRSMILSPILTGNTNSNSSLPTH